MGKCAKCGGELEKGFAIDDAEHGLAPLRWGSGEPKRALLGGIKAPVRVIPIAMFRCSDCGYLEAYARHEFARD